MHGTCTGYSYMGHTCVTCVAWLCVQARGVPLAANDRTDDADDKLTDVDPFCLVGQHLYGRGVTLSSDGSLTWPVLLLYPEYGQSDYIESFHEDSRCVHACTCACVCVHSFLNCLHALAHTVSSLLSCATLDCITITAQNWESNSLEEC